jgi:predicted secreted hydrolase
MNSKTGLLVAAAILGASAAYAADWKQARPDYAWSFPADHDPHPDYRSEWWYFTGHLASTEDPSRRFSYQFTIFRIGVDPARPKSRSRWASSELLMGHAAVTDLANGRHLFADVVYRESPLLASFGKGKRLASTLGPAGSTGTWTLGWNGAGFDFSARDDAQDFAFDLKTSPRKPLILEGPNGYSRKTESGSAASLYYSFTRLRTTGSVRVAGSSAAVAGESWMDKEFGSGQLGPDQVGWDWFSLQFADGRELMLYVLRDKSGNPSFAHGTAIDVKGRTRFLKAPDFHISVLDHWRSPLTGGVYPSRWSITIPAEGRTFVLAPRLADQENRGRRLKSMAYWEGSVDILSAELRPLGEGFVELTGYAPGSAPSAAPSL